MHSVHQAPAGRPFIARHIEQPGSRHSKPALTNNLSSPSGFCLTLDQPGAGHDQRLLDAGRHLTVLDD